MGKNFLMNLEDFTIYFIIITFALYVASRYIKKETFQDGDNTQAQAQIPTWIYEWRRRRAELIPQYDPEGSENGLIYDADAARPPSLKKTRAKNLIDLYRLDEDNATEPDIDDAESEFWMEMGLSRWRNKDWIYRWTQRRNELIPLYDPEEDGSAGLIYDADAARPSSLRKTHAEHLIDLYRLDEDIATEPDMDDAENEFMEEMRISRWRTQRNALLEMITELKSDIVTGQLPKASDEEQAAGRRAKQLITTYRLDADDSDDNAADIILPTISEEVAATVAPDAVTPSPFNNIYLDNYVSSLSGIGCKVTPWGEEICKGEITGVTLQDIDNKINKLTKEIANEERDINISGGNVTINVDENETTLETEQTQQAQQAS